MLLAGDIGGTKTNLAIFSSKDELRTPLLEMTFPSGQYPSLEALVREFLSHVNMPIARACFGVAGPVLAGKAKITNMSWSINEAELQKALNIPHVYLLNDLNAMAHAIPLLEPSDLRTLNAGQPDPQGTVAILAPGTGLGEAFLTRDGSRYYTHPSEGGHVDFAPTNGFELELLRYLLERFEHVSYELICSGSGLPHIYDCLKEFVRLDEPPWLGEQLAVAKDRAPVIVNAALSTSAPDPLCVATVKIFVSIMGAEAGNMALKMLATGGVYVGGGIPPRILPFLEDGSFMKSFTNKGRFSSLLKQIPVHIILNPKLALIGAAACGFEG
ncbi:MAG: glucokinase [Chloroflexi bacterium]|nr:MAG: glucokinase [Chloroflexota bacterium]